jgi:hypothetical protein
MSQEKKPYRAFETVGFCGFLVVVLVIIAFLFDEGRARLITLAFMCLGCAIGYCLGILATPYTHQEVTEFAKVGKLVSAIITGFVLAKIGPVLDVAVSSDVLLVPTNLFRLISFIACTLSTTITVFVYRKYVFGAGEPG